MILSIIFILLIILGIGVPLVLLILPKQSSAITLGLSYPLGIGIFTLAMFLTNLAGFRFGLLNEFLLLFLISIPLVLLANKAIKEFFVATLSAARKAKFAPVEKVMLGIMVFLLVTSFINTFYWPVSLWDSVVLYDFRAHVFASSGFMKDAFINVYYFNYPLLTSLAHSIVYLAGGKYPQFIHSLFYLSLGIGFYGFLREFISRKMSLLFTLILLIAQPLFYHSLLSLTNLPYSVYLSFGAVCIYLWDKKKEKGYLLLSALLVGFSTWTRSNEPFWAAIFIVAFLVSIYRKRFLDILVYSLIFFPIREAWLVFQRLLDKTGILSTGQIAGYTNIISSLFNIQKWGQVIGYLYKYVVMPWGGIFVAFVFSCILLFLLKIQKKLFLIFFITFALLSVLVMGTYAFSLTVENWYRIGDAAQRLSMLFYPLFIYCIALVIQDLVKLRK